MKLASFFIIMMCAQERGVPEVDYAAGVAYRRAQHEAVWIALEPEQRAEIRVAMAEVKTAEAQLQARFAELNLKIYQIRAEVKAPQDWTFDSNTFRFVKPQPQPEVVRPIGGRP